MAEKEYPYMLKWSGSKDTPMFRAAVERCKDLHIFSAADPTIVTHEELNALIEEGTVSPSSSYWDVRPGLIGLVCKSIGNFSQWEMVSNCKADFQAGWEAATKEMG